MSRWDIFNITCVRSGKGVKERTFWYCNPFYKQFRIVYIRNQLIINENSLYPFVFAIKTNAHRILKDLERIRELCGDNTVLCYGGSDMFDKSYYTQQHELKSHFRAVYIENFREKPVADTHRVLPQAFALGYLQKFHKPTFSSLVDSTYDVKKEKLIGTAYGAAYPGLDQKIRDRVNLRNAVENQKLIENFKCLFQEYHAMKSIYKYFASPLGTGLQSSKIYESLMCETVPVLIDLPYSRQLKEVHKLPIHLTPDWKSLTKDSLNEAYTREFANHDWKKTKERFFVDNYVEEFLLRPLK